MKSKSKFKKKKILLLGKNSFFAKNFLNYLKNYKVVKIGRKDNLSKINLKNFNFIINCAADVFNQKLMYKNNLEFVHKLIIQYLLQESQAKIIHFGSAGEYGKLKYGPNERHVLNPMTIYQATKAAATNLILGFSYQFKIPVIILRCYSIFGPYENSTKFIPRLIRHFETNEKLTIYKGSQDYYYIDNLSKIVLQLIKKNSYFSKSTEIINIGSGKYIQNMKVYRIFEKLYKKKGNAKFIKDYQKRTDSTIWVSNSQKLKSYNFIKEVNFIDGLKKYLKKFKDNKKLYNHIYQIKKY